MAAADPVWYFAYGSNMNSGVLEKRRNIKPLERKVGILKGWRFVNNLGAFPWLEPAFGNVARATDDEVHGLLVKMSKKDYEHLLTTEAPAADGGYVPTLVPVVPYGEEECIHCLTLVVDPNSHRIVGPDQKPSARYMGLIVAGAKEIKLEPSYIARLEAIPVNKITPRVIFLAPLILFFLPFLLLSFFLKKAGVISRFPPRTIMAALNRVSGVIRMWDTNRMIGDVIVIGGLIATIAYYYYY